MARGRGVVRQRLPEATRAPPAIQVEWPSAVQCRKSRIHYVRRWLLRILRSAGVDPNRCRCSRRHDQQRPIRPYAQLCYCGFGCLSLTANQQLSFSGFFRNYALALRSDFGDGMIQQSEKRNVFGGELLYVDRVHSWLSVVAGADLRRDVPHNLDLKHLNEQSVFNLVTSNNLALSFVEPFVSLDGTLGTHVHYDVGVRQEAVWMSNQDLLMPR